jgi:uncharacterized protein (TIRG00374 family)
MALFRHFRARVSAWFGLAVSAGAIAWLVRSYDWAGLVEAFRAADWRWLLAAPLLLVPNWLLRAARWRGLFPAEFKPRLSSAFIATMTGYLFNNLLPARAGELMRVHWIGRRDRLPRSTALGTVVVERTLDLLVLLALLALVLFSHPLPSWATHAGKVVALAAAAGLAVLVLLGLAGERMVGLTLPWLGFLPAALVRRLDVSGRAFLGGVSPILRAASLLGFAGLTAMIWLLELAMVQLLAYSFALPLTPGGTLFVMLAMALGTMVPASPGYIGTFEFFGLSALALLGISGSAALGFVVALHAVLLLGTSAAGAACTAYYGWPRIPADGEGATAARRPT